MKNDTNQSLGYYLKLAQHTLRLKMDEALKPLGLTTPQYAVLSQLQASPGISNAALARASFLTAQTMHGIVVNLEKSGLIKRKKSEHNQRVLKAELTKKGLASVEKAHASVLAAEKSMTNSMKKKEVSDLKAQLITCINNLK